MLHLTNFKNFAEAHLDDTKPVTMLVGPNGAGKSNLIEAIELLSFLAGGRPLHEVTDLGRQGALEVRGGLDACASYGQTSFTLGHSLIVATAEGAREATYQISVRADKEPRIIAESLRIEGRDIPVFEIVPPEVESPSADNTVRYDNNARGKYKPTSSIAADRSALSQYARFAHGNQKLTQTLEIIDSVTASLTAPAVFDPIPKLMRNYERQSETRLARNGFNISPVLYNLTRSRLVVTKDPKNPGKNLYKQVTDKPTAQRILSRVSQLPDEPFSDFDFIKTKAGDVMFAFKAAGHEQPVTARVISDGTLRALAVLAALETGPRNQRLILEEFDNGVHPSRVHVLTEALFECAGRNQLRALATTHNPATLNTLTDEQLDSVLLVVHHATEKYAQLLPIRELPGFIEFLEQGRLGDLVTRRVYEKHLAAHYEADRGKEIERWLEALP